MVKRTILVRKSEKGQGFLELGLSLIFMLILLAAVIDLGWAFFTLIALRDSAQEAASVGSICPPTSTTTRDVFNKIYDRFQDSASSPIEMSKIERTRFKVQVYSAGNTLPICTITGAIADPNDTTIFSNPTSCVYIPQLGDSISVTVTYNHEIMTPLVGSFIGNKNAYPLEVTSTNTILSTDCKIQ